MCGTFIYKHAKTIESGKNKPTFETFTNFTGK